MRADVWEAYCLAAIALRKFAFEETGNAMTQSARDAFAAATRSASLAKLLDKQEIGPEFAGVVELKAKPRRSKRHRRLRSDVRRLAAELDEKTTEYWHEYEEFLDKRNEANALAVEVERLKAENLELAAKLAATEDVCDESCGPVVVKILATGVKLCRRHSDEAEGIEGCEGCYEEATRHDSEGVPLGDACYGDAVLEAIREAAPHDVVDLSKPWVTAGEVANG